MAAEFIRQWVSIYIFRSFLGRNIHALLFNVDFFFRQAIIILVNGNNIKGGIFLFSILFLI